MVGKKQILEEIEYSLSFKNIVETYEEIAASRMQRIRNSVLASRNFLLGVNNIFQQVKSSYKIKPSKKTVKAEISFRKTNGKTLFILMSANTGLYGDIIRRTFNVFAKELRKAWGSPKLGETDIAIVGRLGVRFFQEEFPKKKFLFFTMSDNSIDNIGIKTILPHLLFYEKIIVFYQQFQNIITSIPIATSISGDILPWEKPTSEQIRYIFEPSLGKVMEYFERQIILAVFEQIVYESLLAKFASRMVSMEKATENIQNLLKQEILRRGRIRHQELNKKQNQTFGSMMLWITK